MTSFNHYALGSVAEWMHAHIGGLEAIEAGWRRFRVAPVIGGGIDHASTSHVTPYGKASVAWKTSETGVELDVTVPIGATAVVELPDHEPTELVGGTHHLVVAL